MIEDRRLLLAFKSGSGDALCLIYEKYKRTLLKLALALSNDVGVAEDAVQDVFVAFAQSAEGVGLNGSLKGYLATCVANRVRNVLKRRRQGERLKCDAGEEVNSQMPRPEQWVILTEEAVRLNRALAELPYEQREVIGLHLEAGMRFRAVAKVQDVSINTVQSRYRYGLQKLRSLLQDEVNS